MLLFANAYPDEIASTLLLSFAFYKHWKNDAFSIFVCPFGMIAIGFSCSETAPKSIEDLLLLTTYIIPVVSKPI